MRLCAATWLGTAQRHAMSQPTVRCLEHCTLSINTYWLYCDPQICPSNGAARLEVHPTNQENRTTDNHFFDSTHAHTLNITFRIGTFEIEC